MSANKVRFNVCGADYVISTTDTEEYVLSLAEKLQEGMQEVMTQTPSASLATAAVITALDYLDDMKKAEDSAANMRAQIKDYLEDAAKSKLQVEEAHKEIERLRAEIEQLHGESEQLRHDIATVRKQAAQQVQNVQRIASIQQAAAKQGQIISPQQAAQLAAQHARQQQMARNAAGTQSVAATQNKQPEILKPEAQPDVWPETKGDAVEAYAPAEAAPAKETPVSTQAPAKHVKDGKAAKKADAPVSAPQEAEPDELESAPEIPATMNTIEFEIFDEE